MPNHPLYTPPSSMEEESTTEQGVVNTTGCAFEHRAAVALNNMGVTMMERGCYRQAYQTFKDAVHVAKAAVTTSNLESPPEDILTLKHQVLRMLQQANQRASQPDTSMPRLPIYLDVIQHNTPSPYPRHTSGGTVDADSQSEQASTGSLQGAACTLRSSGAPLPALTLIRIDSNDLELFEDENVDLPQIIMLYNFSVVQLCRAKQQMASNPRLADKLHGGAVRLLTLCRSFLCSHFFEACNEDPFLMHTVIQISIVLTETLVETLASSMERSARQEAHHYSEFELAKLYQAEQDLMEYSASVVQGRSQVAPAA